MADLIEVSGTPQLEGKEGFYGSYLNLLAQLIQAHLKMDTLENNKVVAINLIKIGIASIPDPKREYRQTIYDAIEAEIDKQITEAIRDNGGKEISDNLTRAIIYDAYIKEGIGGLSTWMDKVAGLVTKNAIIRSNR